MSEQVRVPERAALRIAAAVQRQEQSRVEAQNVLDTVADALGVPQGWALGRDEAGLFFAPPAEGPGTETSERTRD